MRRFQRILVGIDLSIDGDSISVGSRRAARQARWLAQRTGATLTFLHSTWTDIYEDGDVIRPGPGPEAAQALEELAAEYDTEDAPVELVLVKGRAWLEMISRVRAGKNDLVIIGRRSTAGSRAFGSTARKLIRKCPAPVWVVKPGTEVVHEAVLAATDLSPVGDLAVELGAYVADAHGCELHVVHAWQVPMPVQLSNAGPAADEAALDEIQSTAERRIHECVANATPKTTPTLHVACGSPSRTIRRVAAEVGADLLVMGSLSRSGVAGLLIGSTAERLLEKVECSVLTIKPEGFVSPVPSST